MPESTMSHEDQWKLPKEVLLPAALKSVEEKTIPFFNSRTNADDSFTKWTWEFEIIDGEYMGLHAWGDTDPRLTNHPDNKVRQWAETLRGREFELGEGLNTDDLLGLTCCITVDNIEHKKKDGSTAYMCPVLDVFPPDALIDSEPPF